MLKDIYKTLIESGNERISDEYKNIDLDDENYIDLAVKILSEEYVKIKFKLEDEVMALYGPLPSFYTIEDYLKSLSNGYFVPNYKESEIEIGINDPDNLEILLKDTKYIKPRTIRLSKSW